MPKIKGLLRDFLATYKPQPTVLASEHGQPQPLLTFHIYQENDMDKLMKIITMLMQGEEAVLSAVPVTATGKAGNILGIVLTAEASLLGFLQAHAAQKEAAASAALNTIPPPVA